MCRFLCRPYVLLTVVPRNSIDTKLSFARAHEHCPGFPFLVSVLVSFQYGVEKKSRLARFARVFFFVEDLFFCFALGFRSSLLDFPWEAGQKKHHLG